MGDLGWSGLICALIPVAIVVAILVRAVLITRRRRGAAPGAGSTKDEHVVAFDLGRPPVDPTRYQGGGPTPGL